MGLADFRYRYDFRVVFRDVDYYRHVNNAVYVTYMETARIDYCAVALGKPLGSVQNVIMASQCFDYEKQAQYDDRLVMGVRTSRLGTKSLDFTYELWRADERIAHGASTLVAFDYEANRSIVVPDEWRRRIAEYEVVAPDGLVSATAGGES
ncbi:MAG: acyl-CoA thioesterase [Candidatus Eremiobacteraeota bacterium]|nr:acyl-CoA thioesterase [Candidatus Eremiobacteraeota bacterium]